ncbi:hypothetical protein D3C87_1790150 [compost metagenome]
MRDARGGKRHLLGDAAAKAGELDLLLRGLPGKTLLRGRCLLAMGKELLDILAQDAPGRPRSAQLAKVYAVVSCQQPHRWSGKRLVHLR